MSETQKPAPAPDVAELLWKANFIVDAMKRSGCVELPDTTQLIADLATALETLARQRDEARGELAVYKARVGFDYDQHITDARAEIARQFNRAAAAEARVRALREAQIDLLEEAESAVRQALIDAAHASNDETIKRSSAMFKAETFATAAFVALKDKYRAIIKDTANGKS